MRGLSPEERARRAEALAALHGDPKPKRGRPAKPMAPKDVREYIAKLEADIKAQREALEKIASYEGFEDGAIMLSDVARTVLGWEGYE